MGLSLRIAGTPLYMGSAYVKYVIEAQGYTVQHNILLQGNKSTILLATNKRFSTSKKTKHIKKPLSTCTRQDQKGDLEIHYEPSGCMWSDMLTKPKQGKAFREFRGQLMNVAEDYDDKIEYLNTHPDLLPPADNNDKLLARDYVVLCKPLEMDEKTVPFTETDTFPTRTTATKAMLPRVLNRFSSPQNHRRSLLGKRGIRTPHAQNK